MDVKKIVELIRAANEKGPPVETCKVLRNGRAEAFTEAEDALIRSTVLGGGELEPRDIELYGHEGCGIFLRFR